MCLQDMLHDSAGTGEGNEFTCIYKEVILASELICHIIDKELFYERTCYKEIMSQ